MTPGTGIAYPLILTGGGSTWAAVGNETPIIVPEGFGPAGFRGPIIVYPPQSQTVPAGETASFSVLARGTPPFSYQWLKNGFDLEDDGNISGAYAPTLTLSNVFAADAGGFRVIVTNAFGSVTGQVAALTVLDPFITSPPSSMP